MASQLHIIVNVPRRDAAIFQADVAPETLALLGRLESLWSRFIGDSDLSRINNAAGRAVVIEPETLLLVSTMLRAWDETQGRYDPTILPVLVSHGYGVSKSDPTRQTVLPGGQYRLGAAGEIRVDEPASTVTVPAGVAIDPGGIGKGLAADMAVRLLLDGGARGALVSIGGDMCAAGEPPEQIGWRVDIEHGEPADRPLCQVTVDGGGVATSSTRTRRWRHNGRERHHVIDPFTGAEARTDLAAVTVFANSGWQAEAFATGAIQSCGRGVIDYLESHGLTGLAITTEDQVLNTADLEGLTLAGAK